MNIWHETPGPFFVLAPMADVTDAAFRHSIATYGKPDVMWTEFVSADGLYHTREIQHLPDSENPLMLDLRYGEGERPIVAQLFTAKPDMMEYAARVVTELGFDGVDINMGCPDRSVEKQKAGAALMKNPMLARELIRAAKRGTQGKVAVSVKTRVGYNKVELDSWVPELLAEEPDALTIHARTRKEMSNVPARWEHVRHAVELRDRAGVHTRILGNGDVSSLEEGRRRIEETGADGVMVGRGIFGNPWFFAGLAHAQCGCQTERPATHAPIHSSAKAETSPDAACGSAAQSRNSAERSECAADRALCACGAGSMQTPTHEEKLRVLVEHCRMFEELCTHKSFAVMKKHFKAYVQGFPGAAELRATLMACETAVEVEAVLREKEAPPRA